MTAKIPKGWSKLKLDDVCKPKQWKTIPICELTSFGYPVYGANGIIGFYQSYNHERPTILITCRGATCGQIHISKPFSYVNGNAMALDNLNEKIINLYFLHYQLKHLNLSKIISGTAQPQITKQGLDQISVIFPSILEQKRIVAKLDRLLTRVEACRARLARAAKAIKLFRQAVLDYAISGQLSSSNCLTTKDDFKALNDWLQSKKAALNARDESLLGLELLDLPENWKTIGLSSLLESSNYGSSSKSEKIGSIPVLRMGNIQGGKLVFDDLVFTSQKEEIEKYQLKPGDVLFNRTNSPELVGKTAVYLEGMPPAIFAGYLIRLRTSSFLDPKFLTYCLNSSYGRRFSWLVKSDGVSQSNINAKKLGLFPIPICSIREQKLIVQKVENLLSKADVFENKLKKALKFPDFLTASILAKAFRGELV